MSLQEEKLKLKLLCRYRYI